MLNRVRFDWFSFTLRRDDVDVVMCELGMDVENFSRVNGKYAYSDCLAHDVYHIFFYYNGISSDMGVHVVVNGGAIKHFMTMFIQNSPYCLDGVDRFEFAGSVYTMDTPFGRGENDIAFRRFAKYVFKFGHFTRVDVNFDTDRDCYSPATFANLVLNGWYVTRKKSYKIIEDDSGAVSLYIGKRKSASMLRIYDKAKESGDMQSVLYRFEYQLNDDADCFMRQFIESGLSHAFYTYIYSDIRFVDLSQSQDKYTAPFLLVWEVFLDKILTMVGDVVENYEPKRKNNSIDSLLHMLRQYHGKISDFLENFGDLDDFVEFLVLSDEDLKNGNKSLPQTMEFLERRGWL